jgi:hypothetical protein
MARALGGEVVGGQVSCPGPGHSPRDRSLAVRLSADAPMGFIAFSHCGDDRTLCRDDVARRLGFERDAWKRDRPLEPRVKPAPVDNTDKIREALGYWNESVDPRRTIVELYLNSRALDLTGDIAGSVIRFNARIGAMVSLMRNVLTGQPQAVLRTYLDRDGRKRMMFDRDGKELGERLFKGPTGGAAIMLDPVTDALVIGEGVETCLTGRQKGMGPSWALGSCGEIKKFPLLDGVRSLTIHRERCKRNAEASEICAARWIKAGRKVFDAWPKVGKDINDAVRELESCGG